MWSMNLKIEICISALLFEIFAIKGPFWWVFGSANCDVTRGIAPQHHTSDVTIITQAQAIPVNNPAILGVIIAQA